MPRSSRAGPFRRPLALLLALASCALLPGCLTCAMWDELDHSRGQRVAAVALTPVTVAVDVAFAAGYFAAESCGNGGGGGCRWRGCR